jgi:uncharacterized protein (TIGR00266 family)
MFCFTIKNIKGVKLMEYKLHGDDLQFVEIILNPTESCIAEAGAMMMMDKNINMQTILGNSKSSGLFNALQNAAKRVVTGESLFITEFTNEGYQKSQVSFASSYPGKIIPINLSEYDGKIICQRGAFLCAQKGVNIGIDFTKKLGAGFFGGEGFILQKLEGSGEVFIHAGGTIIKKRINLGDVLKVDTGCLVAMSKDINYDIEFVGGIKNTLFGGEGLFLATLSGEGDVWIQSMPFNRLASQIGLSLDCNAN